jgi:hypothetical protein
MRERIARREKVRADVEAAERAVAEARQPLESGRDPRGGKRIGTAKGARARVERSMKNGSPGSNRPSPKRCNG